MGFSCFTLWGGARGFTSCEGRCVSSCMMPSCSLCPRCSGERKRNWIFIQVIRSSSNQGHQAKGKSCCCCLQLFAGLYEGPSRWDLEGLPACLAALPSVMPAVTPTSPLHVSLLHGGDEAEDCHHGPSLQEGEFLFSIFCCGSEDKGGSPGCSSSFVHSYQFLESSRVVLPYIFPPRASYQCQQKAGLACLRIEFCEVSLMWGIG